jgi:hypothetical protein
VTWTQIGDVFSVPAKPAGLWSFAVEYIDGPCLLRVKAKGYWNYSESGACGPDGDPGSLLIRERLLFPDGPVGALIAKLGGSSAGTKDGAMFLAGSSCIYEVTAGRGPLFFTINDEFTGMANNTGNVTLEVWLANVPQTPPIAKT